MAIEKPNVLFIMCDQLRWDYLSCYGHPTLNTPNIDRIAARGVRFDRAYVQGAVCCSSRMSFYTGRYVSSHGVTWNNMPLRVGERTLGDFLRPLGVRTALVGKTHMYADTDGMAWLGLDADSEIGIHAAQCGFEPFERDDGLHPVGPGGPYDSEPAPYNEYLKEQGFEAENPWDDWANAGEDEDGNIQSGWFLRNAVRPARVPEEHSETPYTTRRAMEFIDEASDRPWCLHLSYIKPHWPYIVPAPYHDMYGQDDLTDPVRAESEKDNPHPVLSAFQNMRVSKTFSRDEVRRAVLPAYMGLIKQIDDQIGVLLDFLEERGLMETTMIVFTSDHGDYLGDHWLGEKDLFHDCVSRIPLIVYDPRSQADATRGTVSDALVEAIDLAPTFLAFFGGQPQPHLFVAVVRAQVVEFVGVGLKVVQHRAIAFCMDVFPAFRGHHGHPRLRDRDAQGTARRQHGEVGLADDVAAPIGRLFPVEQGRQIASLQAVRREMADMHFEWARRLHQRVTVSDAEIEILAGKNAKRGILLGFWDESEVPPELRK